MAAVTVRAIRISSPPDDVNAVHALLERVWAESPQVPSLARFRFETALIELASNIIRHADNGQGVTCTVTIEASDDQLGASMLDDGIQATIEWDREMPDEFDESGRGLPIIQALVDTVEYSRQGLYNHWRITLKLDD